MSSSVGKYVQIGLSFRIRTNAKLKTILDTSPGVRAFLHDFEFFNKSNIGVITAILTENDHRFRTFNVNLKYIQFNNKANCHKTGKWFKYCKVKFN